MIIRANRFIIIASCLLCVLFWTPSAWANAPGVGQLFGRVLSPEGSGIPGARILVRELGSGLITEAVAGHLGIYRVTDLPAGSYELRAEVEGFETGVVPSIQLSAGETRLVDFSLPISTIQKSITVIGKAPRGVLQATEARESAARDIGEALARVSGIWKVRRGGIANDLILRGFPSDNFNVLIDGQRIYGACPNHMDPTAFHVDFSEVDHVEAGKGPFDMRNQGSLGGVLNIVTRNPENGFRGSGNLSGGAYGFINPSFTLSYGSERASALGGFSYRRSLPYTDGSGKNFTQYANFRPGLSNADAFRVGTGWGKLLFSPASNHQIQISYTRQEADHVLYPYLTMDALYDNTNRLNIGYKIDRPSHTVRSVSLQTYYTDVRHWMTDEYRTSSLNLPRPYSMGTMATTSAVGGKLETEIFNLAVGVEAYRRNWDATTQMAGMKYMAQGSIPDVGTTSIGAYADYHQELSNRLKLTVGGRVDRTRTAADGSKANTNLYFAYNSTRSTSATDIYPSAHVQLAYLLPAGFEIRLGAGHTVRVPDARERYLALSRMGSDWVGNPELAPSRNTGLDGALLYRSSLVMISASFYYDGIKDYITVLNRAKVNSVMGVMNSRARSYENVDARMYGSEIQAAVTLTRRLFVSSSLSYVRGRQDVNPAKGILSGNLAEIPPLSARMQMRYDDGHIWGEVEGVFAGAQNMVNHDLLELPTPGYGAANLRLGLNIKNLRIWAGLNNVFDGHFAEHQSYQRDPFRSGVRIYEPGRNIFLNFDYHF